MVQQTRIERCQLLSHHVFCIDVSYILRTVVMPKKYADYEYNPSESLIKLFKEEALRRWPTNEGSAEDCWLWSPNLKAKHTYPTFQKFGRWSFVCRLVVVAFNDGFPKGKHVPLHLCHNKRCWRPTHLRAGTQGENMHHAYHRRKKYTTT